jgi:hypothetical protein
MDGSKWTPIIGVNDSASGFGELPECSCVVGRDTKMQESSLGDSVVSMPLRTQVRVRVAGNGLAASTRRVSTGIISGGTDQDRQTIHRELVARSGRDRGTRLPIIGLRHLGGTSRIHGGRNYRKNR